MKQMKMMMGAEADSKAPTNYRYENKEYLLNIIMNQLGMTDEDLEQEPSWIKAKVREANIDKVLNKN